jgi:hypothetical protein
MMSKAGDRLDARAKMKNSIIESRSLSRDVAIDIDVERTEE